MNFEPLVIWDSINTPRQRCKHLCDSFSSLRPGYAGGKKFCSRCVHPYYMITSDIHCKCCGCQLRRTPIDKNLASKRKKA